jgi:DNA-binding NtrC family response regulator
VAVDCSTIPENMLESELFGYEKGAFTGADKPKPGRIEEADGGTLFLDEIGNLNITAQDKLLRFLNNKKFFRLGGLKELTVDARVICATNKNLREMIDAREFKDDLYYRLNVVEISLPALRERGEDILLIAEHFLAETCAKIKKSLSGFSPEARECLLRYPFPGNVRELYQVVCNAVITAERQMVYPEDLLEKLRTKTVAASKPDAEICFNFAEASKDNFYAQYLPPQFSDKNFIWGLAPHLETEVPDRLTSIRRELHDKLIISVQHALGLPFKDAVKAVTNAFERNLMIAILLEVKGKVIAAADRANVDKKTFIEKMKSPHKLKKEWFVE